MLNRPLISIIIPTYNSEKTLERVLINICNQKLVNGEIEILIIDAGSKDKTIDIASKYGATILNNDKKLPEYGKLIGFINAKGKYVIKQDSDEEYTDEYQLSKRLKLIEENPSVKAIDADRLLPSKNNGISNLYMNCCGDPFTWFVYKKKESITKTFSRNIIKNNDGRCVMLFKDGDFCPIGDGATTMVDLDWIKENYSDWKNVTFICKCFYEICKKTKLCGVVKNDSLIHHSNGSFCVYLSKLKFRVINNIFNTEESGFSSRYGDNTNRKMTIRKYLYILYSLSIVCPIFDSIYLCLKYKSITMLLHCIYTYYVTFNIFIYYILKLLGVEIKNRIYG